MKYLLVGFTVLALAVMTAGPAFANFFWYPAIGSDIIVHNQNAACVSNDVSVTADTGGNNANGGSGGGAGSGGSVSYVDDNNRGGNGGAGGSGGDGGVIVTGNAVAGAEITNVVNRNRTLVVADCDGCGSDVDDVKVVNRNRARVWNGVDVDADTGDNDAGGGSGGGAGSGGSVSHADDGNVGGNGGNAGHGGDGGVINTWDALAGASVFNLVNTNITRIFR